jgi:membrane protein implicated in regulation of membrane protease activity
VALVVAVLLALFVVNGPWVWVVIAGGGAIEIGEALFWWRWTHRRRPAVGVEALLGAEALVAGDGWVRVSGELWRARGAEGAAPGEVVRVREVKGLTLVVEREP